MGLQFQGLLQGGGAADPGAGAVPLFFPGADAQDKGDVPGLGGRGCGYHPAPGGPPGVKPAFQGHRGDDLGQGGPGGVTAAQRVKGREARGQHDAPHLQG